jgi:hypothetical protein
MKFMFFAVSSFAMSSAAFAGSVNHLTCAGPALTGQEKTYSAEVTLATPASASGSFAILRVSGDVARFRMRQLVEMNCVVRAIEPSHGFADQTYPLAFCDNGSAEGGYTLNIVADGSAGLIQATVVARNFVKDETVARMICRSEPLAN